MEISLEMWVCVQRHGQDLADRLAQGFSGLFQAQPSQLPWSSAMQPKLTPFDIDLPVVPFIGGGRAARIDLPAAAVASFVEIGARLGQARSELGACVGGAVQQLTRKMPVSFRTCGGRTTAAAAAAAGDEGEVGLVVERAADSALAFERVGDRGPLEVAADAAATAASASGVGFTGAGGGGLDE